MKRICLFVFFFTLSLVTTAFAVDGVKLGSVDLNKIAQESEAGKKAMGALKEIADKYQDALKTRQKELETLQSALEGKAKSLSAAKRIAREKELQKKFQEFQQYAKNAQQEFAAKESEFSKPIREDLEKLVKEYGRSNGYTAILLKEGLVYIDSKNDLTDEILKLFNAAGKK
jgi:outer membrane protein